MVLKGREGIFVLRLSESTCELLKSFTMYTAALSPIVIGCLVRIMRAAPECPTEVMNPLI